MTNREFSQCQIQVSGKYFRTANATDFTVKDEISDTASDIGAAAMGIALANSNQWTKRNVTVMSKGPSTRLKKMNVDG